MKNIEDLKAREEKYLLILRRWALGVARLLLVGAALLLLVGVAGYGWGQIESMRPFAFPSEQTLIRVAEPCGYLTHSEAESNGKDSEGPIPVFSLSPELKACEVLLSPSKAETPDAAYSLGHEHLVAILSSFNRHYSSSEARHTNIQSLKAITTQVLSASTSPDDVQRLSVARTVESYLQALSQIAAKVGRVQMKPNADSGQESGPDLGQSPPGEVDPRSDSILKHLLDLRFVQNQLQVTVRDARKEFDGRQADASETKAMALIAFYGSLSLFVLFLVVMLTFVFIKIEIDLRDIGEKLKQPIERNTLPRVSLPTEATVIAGTAESVVQSCFTCGSPLPTFGKFCGKCGAPTNSPLPA